MYDVAVIGAGINGCCISYFLNQSGKKVILFDKEGVACGGSGAAGAFISPKFSKGGELKELMDKAYPFALSFYTQYFNSFLTKAPLLHFARFDDESYKLKSFKETTIFKIAKTPTDIIQKVTSDAKSYENVYLLQSGVVDAKEICEALVKTVDFIKDEVKTLIYKDGHYNINGIVAKCIVIANGAYEPIIKEPYIKLRGIWGHRIDVLTSTQIPINLHQFVSISSSSNGKVSIGATHDIHFHPQTSKEPYNAIKGEEELLLKANKTIKLKNVQILKDYTGLRCGSPDYLPLVGKMIDSSKSEQEIVYHPNIYIINGVGGYGFVQAPYIAKQLCENITHDKPIDEMLNPSRFFYRYKKRQIN